MRLLFPLLLLCPTAAWATPWWISEERAPSLSDSLDALWPGHDIDVVEGAPGEANGIWWQDGELFLRADGQLMHDEVAADDVPTQVVLARSWASAVEVFDSGWVPPELESHAQLHQRPVSSFVRIDAGSTAGFEPSVSIASGITFRRSRAGVRLSGGVLGDAAQFSASTLVSTQLVVGRSALELGLGPGLVLRPLSGDTRLSPMASLQVTAWTPSLTRSRIGIGLSADIAPTPQLKDAFAIRAEVSWSFGPAR
ncbi:MAG: hypothetical protein KC912_05050 [Proteobacteria bacterium]|nr:hypothetical protein [Pseudomonadota bacterium]